MVALYLVTLALLPWAWFPPFPWLHEHAQWSDAVFAITATLWGVELWVNKRLPRLDASHAAMALYVISAALSLLLATLDKRAGAIKLLGIIELVVLALMTSDIVARPERGGLAARVIAATSLATAAAAITGLMLFYVGVKTRLVGIYGELTPSPGYARIEAGTYNPNLLASFSIFAAAILARYQAALPVWLRRLSVAGLWVTVALTFSRGILGFALAAALRAARTERQRMLAAAFGVACVGVILGMTFWRPVLDPIHPLALHFEATPSNRYEATASSLRTLVASPLWGSGLGASPGLVYGVPFDAHLTGVNIAATLGLPALMAFTTLVVSLWRKRNRAVSLALWGGLAGLALDGLAQDIEDFRHLWVLIGFVDADSTKQSAVVRASR